MLKYVLIVLCTGGLLLASTAQERTKKKGPADFAKTIERAKASWQAGNFGACTKDLQTCMNLVVQKRAAAIRTALPAAPEGWRIREDAKANDPRNNPMLAAMTASVGSVIERRYDQVEGNGRIDVTVTADSPMIQMLSMVFANPAASGPDAEPIGYGAHKGILKHEDRGLNLQILIAGAHVVEVKLHPPRGMEKDAAEDLLFGLFDQAAVDTLADALTR